MLGVCRNSRYKWHSVKKECFLLLLGFILFLKLLGLLEKFSLAYLYN